MRINGVIYRRRYFRRQRHHQLCRNIQSDIQNVFHITALIHFTEIDFSSHSFQILQIYQMADTSYRLRCQLYAHEQDVRSVSTITEYDGIVSGSRDKTARIWRPSEYVDNE